MNTDKEDIASALVHIAEKLPEAVARQALGMVALHFEALATGSTAYMAHDLAHDVRKLCAEASIKVPK